MKPNIGNILGVIPARGGSKGIPRKNLLKLGDKSLIELAVQSAGQSKRLTRAIVSTDDEEIVAVARGCGGEVPFMRPVELGTDTADSWAVVSHAIHELEESENWHTDIVVLLQPPTPFRTGRDIDAAIQLLIETEADSVITVRVVDYPPHWMLRSDHRGSLAPLIEAGETYARRQDAPTVYQPNGVVYAVWADVLRDNGGLGPDTRGIVMGFEDSINIDELWQYRLAQLLWADRRTA